MAWLWLGFFIVLLVWAIAIICYGVKEKNWYIVGLSAVLAVPIMALIISLRMELAGILESDIGVNEGTIILVSLTSIALTGFAIMGY